MAGFFKFSNFFFYFGLVWAIFFGLRAVSIFVPKDTYKDKKWDWWLYQIWFNALGVFIGWIALYYIWKVGICDFKIEHFAALIIAYLGISGNLPYAALFGKKIP